MDLKLLWIIQLAPLAAFVLISLLPRSKAAPAIAISFALTAAVSSLKLLSLHAHDNLLPQQFIFHWIKVWDHTLSAGTENSTGWLVVGFLVDKLSLLMITLVTTITFFVQLFSAYYMEDDPSRPRYFAFLSFFAFSMTGLVLSNNLLQTFLFWELVGLTSYLLIGFWYEKQSAATAARKAFVLNRLGDLGFYLGTILLFILFGSLNFTDLKSEALQKIFSQETRTWLGVLVFMGVMGKSAQFPLHAWLPDAMEGPTPVSALIHSATMVAAGVFLLSRAFGLFSSSETTLFVILTIGALTASVGACLAAIQKDIKKVLAYSTVSQLGLMVMAIGAGSVPAGMFHLSTHAYFKSLLFLTAGVFIHRFHTNDIWEIGRKGGRKEILAIAALCLGLFSLCGIFPFAGFFSKDMILEALQAKNLFFYAVSIFVSFLTVYYSFRLLFVILFSKIDEAHSAGHPESLGIKICRALPLVALSLISLWVGALGSAWTGFPLLHWLGGENSSVRPDILLTTLALILGGSVAAFFQFKNPEEAEQKLDRGSGFLKMLLDRKFFVDEAYEFIVKKIGLQIAALLNRFDKKFISGILVDQTAWSITRLGRLVSKAQDGLLQDYLSWAIGLGAGLVFWLMHFKGWVF